MRGEIVLPRTAVARHQMPALGGVRPVQAHQSVTARGAVQLRLQIQLAEHRNKVWLFAGQFRIPVSTMKEL
jgi:hypothetical protein